MKHLTQFIPAKQKRLLGAILASSALIAGCSSSNPDSGSSSASALSGAAYDGYIAFGTVFHDVNDNGQLDAFEPRALTDADGYFSTSQDGLTDYCGLEASDARRQYCLLTSSTRGSVRIIGGYDLFTGQSFTGSLSMDAADLDPSGVNVVSPLTSLLQGLDESDQTTLLTALGLTSDDVTSDILNAATVDSGTFGRIYRLHKIVQTIEDGLEDTYTAIGDDNFPLSLSSLIYARLAELIIAGADLNNLSAQEATLRANVVADIEALYASANTTPPTAPVSIGAILDDSDDVAGLVDDLFITPDTTNSTNVTRGLARAVEVVVEKIFDNDSSTEIQNAIDAATGMSADTENYLDVLQDNDEVDFNALINSSFGDITVLDDTAGLTGADDFSDAAGNTLEFSTSDSEVSASISLYFQGESGQGTGDLSMCITFNEVSRDDFDVTGEQVSGTWTSFPGATNSVLLSFDLIGPRQVIVTSRGGNEYGFVFAGTDSTYTSGSGLGATSGDVPASDADCAQQVF